MKKYTDEQRKQILSEYNNSHKVKEICEKYHIVKSTLYNWKREYTAKKPGPYSIKNYSAWDINLMERELSSLRRDTDILSRCGCSLDASVDEKIKAVNKLKDEYKVSTLCRTLKLAKSTYYRREENQGTLNSYQLADEALKSKIKQIFKESKERFGGAKIKIMLEKEYIKVSTKRIIRLMKTMGLKTKQSRGIKAIVLRRGFDTLPNYIQKNFETLSPNQVWVSDITYLPVKDRVYYVCVIMDLFSRRILSYSITKNPKAEFICKTFIEAYKLRGKPKGLVFHSDQGIQYKSKDFQQILFDYGVKQSFSAVGCPLDNAVIEGFFSVMKREEISHHEYQTVQDLKNQLEEYINFFNNTRPMKRLENLSPIQFEQKYRQKRSQLPL